MSNSETPTPTVASDWLVSITPSPRGDWQLPGGIRYNVTFHDGATVADFEALLATLNAVAPMLLAAEAAPVRQATVTESTPPLRIVDPPPDGVEGMDIYGVGFRAEGQHFTTEIAFVSATATASGAPQIGLYQNDKQQYAFATVNEAKFAAFKTATGIDGESLRGKVALDPSIIMNFSVGKKKPKGKGHYINWESNAAPASAPLAPPASNGGGQAWNRTAVIAAISEANPKLVQAAINDALNRVDTTPDMTNEQVVAAFYAKAKAVSTDPKAPAG